MKNGEIEEEEEEDELETKIHEMSREEIEKSLYGYLRIWDVMDDETKYLLGSIGELFALVRRDYHRLIGTLLKIKFQPLAYTVGQYERVFDSSAKTREPRCTGYVLEMKESTLLASMVLSYELIHKIDAEIEEEVDV